MSKPIVIDEQFEREAREEAKNAYLRGLNVKRAAGKARQKEKPKFNWRDHAITADTLQHKEYPPIQYIVPGLIPEGLSMLVGRPKIGKSWMALDAALAVASDNGTCLGGIEPQHGAVLYCALEDNERRLQSRITKILGVHKTEWPKRLTLTTRWARLDDGGVEDIAAWVEATSFPRLIILDTLATVKPVVKSAGYAEDYESLTHLHRLANDVGIAVLVLHHQRKSDAEDPLDTISGTLGLAGCVDTPMVLQGGQNGMSLYIRGRDIEEANHAVSFDKETARWTIQGDAADVHRTSTEQAIRAVLLECKPNTMAPAEIAAAAELGNEAVKKACARMFQRGELRKGGRGEYAHP